MIFTFHWFRVWIYQCDVLRKLVLTLKIRQDAYVKMKDNKSCNSFRNNTYTILLTVRTVVVMLVMVILIIVITASRARENHIKRTQ